MGIEDKHQGETEQRQDRSTQLEELAADIGLWTSVYVVVFLVFSMLFIITGGVIMYEAVTIPDKPLTNILAGVGIFSFGAFIVIEAVEALFGETRPVAVNGVIALLMAVIGAYALGSDMALNHGPVQGLLVMVPSLLGVLVAWRAHLELHTTTT